MGKVHFRYPSPVTLPATAKTNDYIHFTVYVVNDDWPTVPGVVPSCVRCKLAVLLASDPEGRNIIDKAELIFDACCILGPGEVTEIHGTLVMPSYDLFIAFYLYQAIEQKWQLVDSTIFFSVDNPDWPPTFITIWKYKILGLELYKWCLIGLGVYVSVLIARR